MGLGVLGVLEFLQFVGSGRGVVVVVVDRGSVCASTFDVGFLA